MMSNIFLFASLYLKKVNVSSTNKKNAHIAVIRQQLARKQFHNVSLIVQFLQKA